MSTLNQKESSAGNIESREVQVLGPERAARLTDRAALHLVQQDKAHGEQFMARAQWPLKLREADILYQAPANVSAWEGGNATRANVSRFTVAKHVNTLVPDMISGIFYETPPFVLRPRPSTRQGTIRAKTALYGAMLEEMEFQDECEEAMESQVLNGTCVCKAVEYVERDIRRHYIRKKQPTMLATAFGGMRTVPTAESDEFDVKEVETERWKMAFEYVSLTELLIDPGWRKPNKIGKAKWIIHTKYPTFYDLDKLREQEDYEIPSEEELKALFFAPVEHPEGDNLQAKQQTAMQGVVHHAAGRDEQTSDDPLLQPLRLDERWDRERIITVLNDKLVIRNSAHNGTVKYFSANWWNIPNAGMGMGVGKIVGADQRVSQGTTNAALDILAAAVQPMYLRAMGSNVPTQTIRQRLGGILDVTLGAGQRDVKEAFGILELPKVPPETWEVLRNSKEESESATGADEAFGQGRIPGKGSSVARSATGAGGVMAARASKLQGPVGRFCKGILIPFLRHMDERVRERMPMSQIRDVLGEQVGDFELDEANFADTTAHFEVLAGAHLAAKKAMAVSLPWMVSILENPELVRQLNAIGWVVDVKELFSMVLEMSEWRNNRDLIRAMTDVEKQSYQQMNPQLGKVRGEIMRDQSKLAGQKDLVEQKSQERLAEKLVTTSLDRASAYEEREALRNTMRESANFA